ncbi:MAG: sugar phosphate isomerase/epimerase [Verrucomicrobiae bacterium]|nr:sugar phosphate isomerase/epimerase [Verrucomicrobiae bacterium]
MKRRHACKLLAGATAASLARTAQSAPETTGFKLRYILSSAMFGEMPLDTILPEVAKTEAEAIDIWCKPHGNQREQIDAMGHDQAQALFAEHKVTPAVFTRYPLGPFALQEEMRVAKNFGAAILVCGTGGPSEPKGIDARKAMREFLEKMKPHVAAAEAQGLTIALENHDRQLLYHPDSLRCFAELNKSKHLGIAFAPHHLHAFTDEIPALIRDLGADHLPFIYFQEHSEGIRNKVAKEIEMQQMPGFGGSLDYKPVLKALEDIGFTGYGEIFMHPTPRGIPILPTVAEITNAINRSRAYLESCL